MNPVVERTVMNDRTWSTLGLAERKKRLQERDRAAEEAISRRIEENSAYAHYFNKVTCQCSAGVVVVGGCVPTDRLKQVLWSLILSMDEVTDIYDPLDVVTALGLSSIRPR